MPELFINRVNGNRAQEASRLNSAEVVKRVEVPAAPGEVGSLKSLERATKTLRECSQAESPPNSIREESLRGRTRSGVSSW